MLCYEHYINIYIEVGQAVNMCMSFHVVFCVILLECTIYFPLSHSSITNCIASPSTSYLLYIVYSMYFILYPLFIQITTLTGGQLHFFTGALSLEDNVVRLEQQLVGCVTQVRNCMLCVV